MELPNREFIRKLHGKKRCHVSSYLLCNLKGGNKGSRLKLLSIVQD